jgi:hypothetical protein
MDFVAEYQRAAEAAAAANAAAQQTHASMFDFAAELGRLVKPLTDGGNPLGLGVRFIRREPPRLDAPGGVMIEDATKDKPASFAAVALETTDLWFEVRSDPTKAVDALTNIPEMETYASKICGIINDADGHPHLLQNVPETGLVAVPRVSTAAQLLEAFLVLVEEVLRRRANFNPSPTG